ncbi:glycosyltransferase [Pseudobdellovibrio sp. HCB154]|uniref:glycosyltransferase n=1 Tax=Pseudobdellovibrio sp. HCB154 TaxID=3386277 RepID=UPI00391709BB
MINSAILIPSYKPTPILIEVIEDLRRQFSGLVVVVNDGNENEYLQIFERLKKDFSVEVVHHATNLGKGRALKTGFNHILINHPQIKAVVTADADGQHQTADILRVAAEATSEKNPDLVIGERKFEKSVPLRSRFGNVLTSYIFKFLVGLNLSDTQTGLRGFHRRILPSLLKIQGERYEFETNILLETKNQHWSYQQVPITTVYIDDNQGSHFNPFFDSMKIYFLIIRFLGSSLSSSFLDFLFYAYFIQRGMKVYESMILARFLSGWVNFYLNKKLVFRYSEKYWKALIRYWSLVLVMGTLSSFIVNGLMGYMERPILLKLLAESMLFLASFAIQKEFVFNIKQKTNL